MPHKIWVVGEEVLAPDFNTYVQQQVIEQFPTTAARGSAVTAPVAGQASYIDSNDINEGPEFWNGTAWRKPWNMPWGYVGWARNLAGQGGFGATVADISGMTVAFTAIPNRLYKATASLTFDTINGASIVVSLCDAANGIQNQACIPPNTIVTQAGTLCFMTFYSPAPGAATAKLRCQTTAGNTNLAGHPKGAYLIVEDVGPALGAVPA